MTLNISLVSKRSVFLSSDFRLTYFGRAESYTDHEAQKIVLASKFGWNALVQFTGVAKTNRHFDTSQWLADLVNDTPMDAPLSNLLQRLAGIEGFIGRQRHTFTVAGFVGGAPFLCLVSNFQHVDPSRDSRVNGRMSVSRLTIRGVHSVVTGLREYVLVDELRELRKLVRSGTPALRIHELLDDLNARAATRAGPEGGISESSFTGHLTKEGTGEMIPHRVNEGGEYLPAFALSPLDLGGIELKATLDETNRPLPRRLVGMTVTNNGNGVLGTIMTFRNIVEPTVRAVTPA